MSRKNRVGEIGSDTSQGAGDPPHHGAGNGVGPITEFEDSGLDLIPRLRPDVAALVDHPGYGLMGDTSEVGNIMEGDPGFFQHIWLILAAV
jgi:hypothetical protein